MTPHSFIIPAFILLLGIVCRADARPGRLPEGLSDPDWQSIRAAYQRHRHRISPAGDGFCTRNPGQGWQVDFDRTGFLVRPDDAGWTWGLELADADAAESPELLADGGTLTRRWSDQLEEWYINDTRGVEHGYTVWSRDAFGVFGTRERNGFAAGPLSLPIRVRGGLKPVVEGAGTDVRFENDAGAALVVYRGLKVEDASGRRLPARFEPAGGDTIVLHVDDTGAEYPVTIDPVAQQAYLKASNSDADDGFGISVAISGNTVVVGALQESSSASGVNGNQSSNSLSLSGAAYVFVRSQGTWSQQAYLKAPNPGAGDNFGNFVAIDGDVVVVGAHLEDSSNSLGNNNLATNSGAAYVYTRSGSNWTYRTMLKASNIGADDRFGYSGAVSGDTIVIGARWEGSAARGVNGNQSDNSAPRSGAAYVFSRAGNAWTQQAYLKASNTNADDWFGNSVAISGNTIVVGSRGEASSAAGVNGNQNNNSMAEAGAAYVFVRSGSSWTQQAYLKASNPGAGDRFGTSVSISGDTIVVGADREDSSATGVDGDGSSNGKTDSGAAYIFERSGGQWRQTAYLKASNCSAGSSFGFAVAVSGDVVLVGAKDEDSGASGIDGDQSGSGAVDSGAVYAFGRTADGWSQFAYLKSSNSNAGDHFGHALAISGTTAVIGAYGEDSAADGVDGSQSNNSAPFAGAAYVFTGLEPPAAPVEIPLEVTDLSILVQGARIRFRHTPGATAVVERSANLQSWQELGEVVSPEDGNCEFVDPNPPAGRQYYRIRAIP